MCSKGSKLLKIKALTHSGHAQTRIYELLRVFRGGLIRGFSERLKCVECGKIATGKQERSGIKFV